MLRRARQTTRRRSRRKLGTSSQQPTKKKTRLTMKTCAFKNQLGRRTSHGRILTAIAASLLFISATFAQVPTSPWKKGAPFPEPDEELYGVAVNGKLYVIGGWGEGKARGANYEYDPATDKWTKKKSMPRPAHHAALAAYNGKIYVCGGFVAPEK